MSDYPNPPISVTGGRAGHRAVTDDLERAAGVLKEAADELHLAGGQMGHAHGLALDAASAAIAEVRPSVLEAQYAVHDTQFGVGGFNTVADELAAVSGSIKEVARAYERAEAAAYQGVSQWTRVGRGFSDWVGLSIWSQRAALAAAMRTSPADWLLRRGGGKGFSGAVGPDGMPRVTGLLNGQTAAGLGGLLDSSHTAFGTTYESVLWLLARSTSVLERWFGEPRYVGVAEGPTWDSIAQPQGVADLVAGIGDAAVLEHGGITIDTIEHPDGTVSRIVNIPGTNDTTMSDKSVRDWNSNFRGTGNNPSDAAQMVRDAIEASGIGPDEPIMLQGHSQGGGVAAQLAVELADDYTITHVVTYGAATDRVGVLPDVEYLNLVTTQDSTPGGDAKTPPDLPNVTNVELDLESAPDPDLVKAGATVSEAHSLGSYHAAARTIDASDHLSLGAWREGASDFFGNGQMSRQEFKPTFESPQSSPAPAPGPTLAPGEVYGPPVPPPDPQAGQKLRDALIKDRDPVWSRLLDPDGSPGPGIFDWMESSGVGASPQHP